MTRKILNELVFSYISFGKYLVLFSKKVKLRKMRKNKLTTFDFYMAQLTIHREIL